MILLPDIDHNVIKGTTGNQPHPVDLSHLHSDPCYLQYEHNDIRSHRQGKVYMVHVIISLMAVFITVPLDSLD